MLKVFVATSLLILGCLNVSSGSPVNDWKSFNGYQLIRAFAENFEQGMALADLQKSDSTLDFWTEPCVNGNTDIMVAPEKLSSILQFLENQGIKNSITIEDVGKIISSQKRVKEVGAKAEMTWADYNDLETVYDWFSSLAANNSYIDVIDIGKSFEGRDVKVVRMSKDLAARRPAIFIDSAIHAREWISLATVSYIMNQLVNNPDDQTLLDDVDFYFLPVINPDGYAFTHSSNRMWRKTRSLNGNCIGCDANRNFDYEWNSCSGCSSGSCSSETFRGQTPFSESETEAMRAYIQQEKDAGVNFQSYISVHSYGQYFMLPWGYTSTPPQDYAELQMVADYVKGNISALYGTEYLTGSSSTTIYPTDGTSQDWAYGTGIFKYTYTAELRDTGRYGFLLPADQIIPTAEETWAGFRVVAKHIVGK